MKLANGLISLCSISCFYLKYWPYFYLSLTTLLYINRETLIYYVMLIAWIIKNTRLSSWKQYITYKLQRFTNNVTPHPTKRKAYIVTYKIGMQPYKLIVKKRRGVSPIVRITTESGKNITSTFREYLGPNENFHKTNITPCDIGINEGINIELRDKEGENIMMHIDKEAEIAPIWLS